MIGNKTLFIASSMLPLLHSDLCQSLAINQAPSPIQMWKQSWKSGTVCFKKPENHLIMIIYHNKKAWILKVKLFCKSIHVFNLIHKQPTLTF